VYRLAVIILNFRTPDLTIACLESIVPQLVVSRDVVIVVDNCSGDGSAERINETIESRGWSDVARVVRSCVNGGFAAGNNAGIRAVDARWRLLLNSDTVVRPGAVEALLSFAESNHDAGLIGPRLEWPDGTPQISCFRNRSPWREFLRASSTRLIARLAPGGEVGLPVSDQPIECDWASFAAILIRHDVIERVGMLDELYFMYFEDIDYCRRARAAGFRVRSCPAARVVHLRGGTSDVKAATRERRRLPRYYYESRARYFAKHYGVAGLWLTNALWSAGFLIAQIKRALGGRADHLCEGEFADNWINWRAPHSEPSIRRRNAHAAS
jgi:N-acetylglucosaminyl-diphospho-decaprenol L-rhamnosyltransferase